MRRVTRFSIRSLLVFVTLSCVFLGWYQSNKRRWDREVAALDQLEQLCFDAETNQPSLYVRIWRCGEVPGRSRYEGMSIEKLNTAGVTRSGPGWLRRWLTQWDGGVTQRIDELRLTTCPIDDRAIPCLIELKSLKTLTLEQSRLTPEGEAKLRFLLPDTDHPHPPFTQVGVSYDATPHPLQHPLAARTRHAGMFDSRLVRYESKGERAGSGGD